MLEGGLPGEGLPSFALGSIKGRPLSPSLPASAAAGVVVRGEVLDPASLLYNGGVDSGEVEIHSFLSLEQGAGWAGRV